MSTELVAIEKIEIRHGDKNADEIRMELVKYLRQFLDSASIESMTLHDLAISINGEMILYLVDKTGGKGLRGLDEDWQKDHKTVDSVNMILNDVDVTVVLSYEMIHYFSNDTFYGFNYWSDVLHGNARIPRRKSMCSTRAFSCLLRMLSSHSMSMSCGFHTM